MTEPNYQKPPLREEIEEFFKQLKGVIIVIISIVTVIAIFFGFCKFSETNIAKQIGTYINEHFPAFMFTAVIAFPSYYPELFDILNSKNSGYTVPAMFYSNTLDNTQNKLSINTEDPRYKTYRDRAYWQMTRDQNPESPFKLCKESFFE